MLISLIPMGVWLKLPGVFSLSAATLALLQSSQAAETDVPAKTLSETISPSVGNIPDSLLLSPADQNELLRLYAGHRSHSSHSSHSSHYSSSGYSSGGGSSYVPPYRSPSTVTPSLPAGQYTPPAVQYAYPQTKPIVDDQDLKRRVLKHKKLSAAKGLPTYQYELGKMYLNGDEVDRNEKIGRFYLEMSAQQGNTQAAQMNAAFHKTNDSKGTLELEAAPGALSTNASPIGNTSGTQKLKLLFEKAAAGSADAQYELGMAYIAGEEMAKDLTIGKLLLEMAAAQGKPEAVEALLKVKE